MPPVGRRFLDGKLSKHVRLAVFIQAMLLLIAIWGYTAWRLNDDREQSLETGRQHLRTTAAAMHVHVLAILNDGLGAARASANEVGARGGLNALSDDQIIELLTRHLSGGDYVRALFVSTTQRFVQAERDGHGATDSHPPGWLQAAFNSSSGGTYVGRVLQESAVPVDRILPVAINLGNVAGESLWAGALIGMQSLNEVYQSMAIDDGMLALVSAVGEPLFRVPRPPLVKLQQRPQQRDVLFRKGASLVDDDAFMTGISPVTGTPWIYSVRRFDDSRAMAVAGREVESILAPWRARSFAVGQAMLAISLLVVLLTAVLQNLLGKLAKREADLEKRVADRTAALQEANLRLALTNQELEAFAASASHDLRSPLMSIAGHANLLQQELRPRMSESIRRRIDRINTGVKRSSEIVDGLLSLARLARQELLIEPVDMSSLAQATVEELRQQYPERNVQFSMQDGMHLVADPRLIKSLLANLLGNAWKYTRKCSVAQVHLQCARDSDPPVFSVSDNGAGFPMRHAHNIFQPFQRLHSASDYPGVGIGLTTVARIVQRYSGKIWVESEVDKGTTFYFTLPAATVNAQLQAIQSGQRLAASGIQHN